MTLMHSFTFELPAGLLVNLGESQSRDSAEPMLPWPTTPSTGTGKESERSEDVLFFIVVRLYKPAKQARALSCFDDSVGPAPVSRLGSTALETRSWLEAFAAMRLDIPGRFRLHLMVSNSSSIIWQLVLSWSISCWSFSMHSIVSVSKSVAPSGKKSRLISENVLSKEPSRGSRLENPRES